MKVFALAIPRFPERMEYIKTHLVARTQFPTQIISVDGRKVDRAENYEESTLTDGQLGCALGHVKACREIVEQNLDWALVVEDDIELPAQIDKITQSVAKHLGTNEVISLYCRWIKPAEYSTVGSTETEVGRLIYPMDVRFMRTTAAYIVGAKAAEGIMRVNSKATFVADSWTQLHRNGAFDSIRLLYPLVCRIQPFESTIGYTQGRTILNGLKRTVNLFPFASRARLLRRYLTLRRRERNIAFVDRPSPMDIGRQAFPGIGEGENER